MDIASNVLSPPAARRHLHTRRIALEGFHRDDGLWDIEARIVDTKTYAYTEEFRGEREPGEHVHDMAVRLTLDPDMVVRAIEVAMPSTPYAACGSAAPAYQGLVGKQIGAGWRKAVQECVGGVKGCTHVRELLFPMATVAYQTLSGWGRDGEESQKPPAGRGGRPYFIDGCKAWSASGEVVAKIYPEFFIAPDAATTRSQ